MRLTPLAAKVIAAVADEVSFLCGHRTYQYNVFSLFIIWKELNKWVVLGFKEQNPFGHEEPKRNNPLAHLGFDHRRQGKKAEFRKIWALM